MAGLTSSPATTWSPSSRSPVTTLAGSGRTSAPRIGSGAVQLCALPWLGWIPDDLSGCTSAAVDRLAGQLGLAGEDGAASLAAYGGWEGRTRRDHRALVLARLGWRASGAGDRKQLDAFLLARHWNMTRPYGATLLHG